MHRIPARAVKDAFAQIGLTPIQGDFYKKDDFYPEGRHKRTYTACCGLSALLFHRNVEDIETTVIFTDRIAETLGVDPDYVRGFIGGWDGEAVALPGSTDPHPYDAGVIDGRAAWRAVSASA